MKDPIPNEHYEQPEPGSPEWLRNEEIIKNNPILRRMRELAEYEPDITAEYTIKEEENGNDSSKTS